MTNQPSRSYIICTTPRSGSTMLCKMLAATGVAGEPDSYFHVPSLERWLNVYGLDQSTMANPNDVLSAVFDAARARGMANTDIFGLRMQRASFHYFLQQLSIHSPNATCDKERFENVFGPTVFIHLTRKDRVDQAISRLRAEQTGLWHRHADGTELERLSLPSDAQYDAGAITRFAEEFAAQDAEWEDWFRREKLAPLRITYDDLSNDPQNTLTAVLSFIGCDPSVAEHIRPSTAKLADRESLAWKNRFMRENVRA